MKELLYFSFADLMARIEYHHEANSLGYATQRKMTCSERVLVEQYLLNTFALKTEYYERQPALLICLGTDPQLTRVLHEFHSRNTRREPVANAKEINDAVRGLISQSMQNYYFEQIGETILAARRSMANSKTGFTDERRSRPRSSFENMNASRGRRKMKLEELVKAYNVYADQKITIAEIIPSELKSKF